MSVMYDFCYLIRYSSSFYPTVKILINLDDP